MVGRMAEKRRSNARSCQKYSRNVMASQNNWLIAVRRTTTGSPVEPDVRASRTGLCSAGASSQ